MTRTIKETLAMPKCELMNSPEFDWTRPRRARRTLVLAFVILVAALAAVFGLAVGQKNLWYLAGFAAIGPLLFATMGFVNASVRGLTEVSTSKLDEWQIAKRDAMFRICWGPGVALVGLAAAICAMSHVGEGLKAGLAMGSFMAALFLPTAALAWTLPEELGEDDLPPKRA